MDGTAEGRRRCEAWVALQLRMPPLDAGRSAAPNGCQVLAAGMALHPSAPGPQAARMAPKTALERSSVRRPRPRARSSSCS